MQSVRLSQIALYKHRIRGGVGGGGGGVSFERTYGCPLVLLLEPDWLILLIK